MFPQPTLQKNDKKASVLIIIFSAIVFIAITALSRIKWDVDLGFDKHIFAKANAFINTTVAILLIAALVLVKKGNYNLHKKLMMAAMFGDAKYGDSNQDGVVDVVEKLAAGNIRYFYYVIVGTHILLAGIAMPFVLFTAYRALIGEYAQHKKLARITWPIWFYVAVTGPLVYWMIRQYYAA
jgi:putative membrane protein